MRTLTSDRSERRDEAAYDEAEAEVPVEYEEEDNGTAKEASVTLNSRPRMAVSRPSSCRNGGCGRRKRVGA